MARKLPDGIRYSSRDKGYIDRIIERDIKIKPIKKGE